MTLPTNGWKNKKGTSSRSCSCGSWKDHWIKETGKSWPTKCSVEGCNSTPVLGAHIYNTSSTVEGEFIAPFCNSCNSKAEEFNLKNKISLAYANKKKSCEK